jgi:hypothetical protein
MTVRFAPGGRGKAGVHTIMMRFAQGGQRAYDHGALCLQADAAEQACIRL